MTLLSKQVVSVTDFGMFMNGPAIVEPTSSSASATANPDIEMTGDSSSGALHERGGLDDNRISQSLQQLQVVQMFQLHLQQQFQVQHQMQVGMQHSNVQLFQLLLLLSNQLTGWL